MKPRRQREQNVPEPSKSDNGRTHEPNLRELTADLDGLRELFEADKEARREVDRERDRRYEERFIAAEKLNAIVANTSDRAVNKAEEAQREYNVRSNEFRGQLDDQAKLLMPRNECDQRFNAMAGNIDMANREIAKLRESRSEGSGRRMQTEWIVSVTIAVIGLIIAATVFYSKKP